jgi:hypothetical protein
MITTTVRLIIFLRGDLMCRYYDDDDIIDDDDDNLSQRRRLLRRRRRAWCLFARRHRRSVTIKRVIPHQ